MKKGTVDRVLEYYLRPEHYSMFGLDVLGAMDEFTGQKGAKIEPDMMGHFTEWFLYDYKFNTGETPLEYFYNKNPFRLADEEREVYKNMQNNLYDIFEVADLMPGSGMVFECVRTGEKYSVSEKAATQSLNKKDVVMCRIIDVGGVYEMAGGSVITLPRLAKGAKDFLYATNDKLTPKIAYSLIRGIKNGNFEKIGEDKVMITGALGGVSQEEYDDCAVCQLMKKCKEEGREPTEEELMQAMKKPNS